MNYELAKELRDGGFKQGVGVYLCNSEKEAYKAYVPTLSELTEACGEMFVKLERTSNSWLAYLDCSGTIAEHYEVGETQEEAVAKLWLVLNKK